MLRGKEVFQFYMPFLSCYFKSVVNITILIIFNDLCYEKRHYEKHVQQKNMPAYLGGEKEGGIAYIILYDTNKWYATPTFK